MYDPISKSEVFDPWEENPDRMRNSKHIGYLPTEKGSYHMKHYIDDELAIVGVLDYTDTCLSSVYLFYDPKYEFLSPGTLAAIREIEHVRKIMTTGMFPESFKWYYMGYYF